MLLRRWVRWRGAESAIAPLSSASRSTPHAFSTTAALQKKKTASTTRHKEKRRHRQQQAAPPTTRQTIGRAESTASLSLEQPSISGAFESTRRECSIEEKEKALLRYFGRARHHYDSVPLHKASAALQCSSNTQASRVPFATLFPSPPSPPSSPASHDATSSFGGSAEVHRNSTNSDDLVLPPLSHATAAFSPSNLFLGYDYKLRRFSDWTVFRMLNSRFSNAVDANKLFGAREVPLHDIAKDTTMVWSTLCAAWERVLQQCAAQHPPVEIPLRQSACFVVCFAQTLQNYAVGASLQEIAEGVVARCQASRTTALPIFAVVPVYVGLRAPEKLDLLDDTAGLQRPQRIPRRSSSSSSSSGSSSVEYASGGLYTCSAVVQCLYRMEPHTCTVSSKGNENEKCTYSLDSQLFLVSDAWLNARSVADLHNCHHHVSSDEYLLTGSSPSSLVDAPKTKNEGFVTWDGDFTTSTPSSFIPDASRQRVHVFPGVISDQLSAKERSAFGSYLWSTMQRACKEDRDQRTTRSAT